MLSLRAHRLSPAGAAGALGLLTAEAAQDHRVSASQAG